MSTSVRVKRIYEPIDTDDGHRVLVDRIWPRGIAHERAALDAWMPEVAPSTELRKWFAHDPDRWPEFQARYQAELVNNPLVAELATIAAPGRSRSCTALAIPATTRPSPLQRSSISADPARGTLG